MKRFQPVEVRLPKWRLRAFCSVVVMLAAGIIRHLYMSIQGPLESEMALKQVNGTNADYVVGHWFATANIPGAVVWIALVLIAALWIPYLIKLARYYSAQPSNSEDAE